jgi:hypothetical protein
MRFREKNLRVVLCDSQKESNKAIHVNIELKKELKRKTDNNL